MIIGIDISQIVYQGTGVAKYTKSLVENLLEISAKGGSAPGGDKKKSNYILFASSLRRRKWLNGYMAKLLKKYKNVSGKTYPLPPALLDFLWNKLHILPIERFIGPVDVFLSSDWTQPPTVKARKVTTVHDLTPWKFPKEMHPKIVAVHRRRLKWIKKECDLVIADSKATKKDLVKIVGIPEKKIRVIYLGY